MKKYLVYIAIVGFLFFFYVSNFTALNVVLPQCSPYRYCSNKCEFEAKELGKGADPVGRVEFLFYKYKIDYGTRDDVVLYRRFHRKWWQIWNWYDFLTNRRWTYPYAETDEET